jgi:hypothetical protein
MLHNLIQRFSLGAEGKSRPAMALLAAMRRNQATSARYKDYVEYVENWPIVLDALRRLWEMGKVSELETPFYESFEKPAKK